MMRRYRWFESELQAMQWTAETEGQLIVWLVDHEFDFHTHDADGDLCVQSHRPAQSMCIDAMELVEPLELWRGMWLTWDPATNELSYDVEGFDDAWRLAE